MTSLSTMIAMIPLVVGNIGPGAGEGSRLAVGATILGGMTIRIDDLLIDASTRTKLQSLRREFARAGR